MSRKNTRPMQTPRTMITFKEHGTRFTYRIGGIALHNNRVLLQYADEAEPFWFLPGGRAEIYEPAQETLKLTILRYLLDAHRMLEADQENTIYPFVRGLVRYQSSSAKNAAQQRKRGSLTPFLKKPGGETCFQ